MSSSEDLDSSTRTRDSNLGSDVICSASFFLSLPARLVRSREIRYTAVTAFTAPNSPSEASTISSTAAASGASRIWSCSVRCLALAALVVLRNTSDCVQEGSCQPVTKHDGTVSKVSRYVVNICLS